jgi:hypothetical protein
MQLTERDGAILKAVYDYRLLTSEQIEALLFRSEKPRGRQTSCQRRLQLLFHHGLLNRLNLPIVLGQGRAPFVYELDQAGAQYLVRTYGIDQKSVRTRMATEGYGALFVDHLLSINSVRIAFSVVKDVSEWRVDEWIADFEFRTKALREKVPYTMRGNRIERKFPDGYFVVTDESGTRRAHFFLEVDEGTMSTTRWGEKIRAYKEYRSLGHATKHFNTVNIRLLTVVQSEKRLETLKAATEKVGGDRFFWFTTHSQLDIFTPTSILTAAWAVATRDARQTLLGPT